jgi:serine/threonine protein kinase
MAHWQQVEEVLQGALDRPWPERDSFVAEACAGDEELKREAQSLIAAADEAGDFIEQPALSQDAYVLLGGAIEGQIGPYMILECLGSGGMGEVYLAQDTRLNRPVALKILPSYFAGDDARLFRFQREARAASALNHPNILTIHEVGEHEDLRFIATEYVDGHTLRWLMENGSLSADEIIDIAIQIASALSAAHRAGIIHRDIKPENVMRRADGLVKILDFGIAKLVEQEPPSNNQTTGGRIETEVGVMLGTVNYMSPEQARAVEVDERTDIWSLGVVLYELLAKRLPFERETRMDTLVSILERKPEPLPEATHDGVAALQQIIDRALEKNRSRRYANAEEMLADLRDARELKQPTGGTYVEPRRRTFPSSKTAMTLMVVSLVLLTVGMFIGWRLLSRSRRATVSSPAAAKVYLEMTEAEQLAFVEAQEHRISAMMGDRQAKLNEEAVRTIKAHVDFYLARNGESTQLGNQRLRAVYERAPPLVPLISRSFAARKVPIIIGIYLPVVESAYRDCYQNSFGAKGLFQFLPQTAKLYGVSESEMCDVEKMAPAAAHYIADRMAELGDDSQSVTLVLVSYNRGPEWVRDTLRELRGSENYQRSFWTMFANRDKLDESFRRESAAYVPAFFAAAIIGENPGAFGLTTPPLSTLSEVK